MILPIIPQMILAQNPHLTVNIHQREIIKPLGPLQQHPQGPFNTSPHILPHSVLPEPHLEHLLKHPQNIGIAHLDHIDILAIFYKALPHIAHLQPGAIGVPGVEGDVHAGL